MKRQLVLIHGRSQERKVAKALKAEWLEAFKEGLAKSEIPYDLSDPDVRFAYYGDTLFEMVDGKSADESAEVIVRGTDNNPAEQKFIRSVLNEIVLNTPEAQAALEAEVVARGVVDRGILNWEWIQSILQVIDRHVPHGSALSIALVTRDVYHYLTRPEVRDKIDEGVLKAFLPNREAVVVSHSLGTVVAYDILRRAKPELNLKVKLLVTLGSPLAVEAIKKTVRSLYGDLAFPPGVTAWFNAMDERDVVALYPLSAKHFPIYPAEPAIVNKTDVRNKTQNRHGIAGYLDNKDVAETIYRAL